jgi:methylase of polypeptide subunit release factors
MTAPVPEPSSAAVVRTALERSDYSTGGLMVALGDLDADAGVAVRARRLGEDDQAVLARLFLLGLDVDAARAATALAPAEIGDLERAGWLEREGDRVRARLRITPFEGLLLAHDAAPVTPGVESVPGPGPAARTLAALTPRDPVRDALDAGTGCGLHALLAARHAERVVATDADERALAFTGISARLTGIGNVECRRGAFFEPVEGERFDLVVCDPSLAVSPDAPAGHDELARRVVTGAAAALAPDGLAQLMVQWIHHPFASWAAPLEEWLAGSGCDALLLHRLTESPLDHAARWNAHLRDDPEAHGEALDRWTEHFAREGIASVATGAVTLRRTARTEPLVTHHEMTVAPRGRAGRHVVRLLEAAEWLAQTSDPELMATPLRIVDDHALVSERVHSSGSYAEDTISVVLDDSAGLAETVGPAATAVLMGIEGGQTPADALPGLAGAVGQPPTDPQELVADMTRALVARGVLVRV